MSDVDVPSDPVEVARFFLKKGDDANKEAVMEILADEVELFMDRGPSAITAEAAWTEMQSEYEAMPDLSHEIHDVWRTDEEGILFAEYTLSGTFTEEFRLGEDAVFEPNGKEVTHTGIMKFRIEDSQVTGWGYFADNMPLFQKMGIIPPFSELATN